MVCKSSSAKSRLLERDINRAKYINKRFNKINYFRFGFPCMT